MPEQSHGVLSIGREVGDRQDIFTQLEFNVESEINTGMFFTPDARDLRIVGVPKELLAENLNELSLERIDDLSLPERRTVGLVNTRITAPTVTSTRSVRLRAVADLSKNATVNIVNEANEIRAALGLPGLSKGARKNIGTVSLFTVQGGYQLWEESSQENAKRALLSIAHQFIGERLSLGSIGLLAKK